MVDATHVKQVVEVREISAITYGFMAPRALFAAVEFDLFTHIARGVNSLPVLVQATGIVENRLETLLTALKSLGLIAERNGRFSNAPATAQYLVAGAAGDFRDYVRLVNGNFGYESFRHLSAALRGERIFPDKGFYEGLIYSAGIGGEQFSSAQHSGSVGPARLMARRVDLGGRKRLLDVGGGSGAYTLAFVPPIHSSKPRSSTLHRQSRRPSDMPRKPASPTVSRIRREAPSQPIGRPDMT
jgi:hypothetical protein